jgi:SAM-dependent methyltransferase
MEQIKCIICGMDGSDVFSKLSGKGENFNLMKCFKCSMEFISPRPDTEEIRAYYTSDYFLKRTQRGYNNYFSDEVRIEIERVFQMNLKDLGFFEFENDLNKEKKCLDIGCAAGYFVNFMKSRAWESSGIDVSAECVNFGKTLGLNIIKGDYLKEKYDGKFDLITLWASIEHLHYPEKFIKKISEELDINGMLYISTCRAGFGFKTIAGKKWRYYNFPEHLFYFSISALKKLLGKNGFRVIEYKTYGSGFGRPGSIIRKIADYSAKKFYLGDMMIISAKKV